jgi:SAM-dependent methyltransferase
MTKQLRKVASRFRKLFKADKVTPPRQSSTEYRLIDASSGEDVSVLDGWRDLEVAQRQHEAYAPLLAEMDEGRPRIDLQTAADAVAATGMEHPSILEVGCGSGYYSRVFKRLLSIPFTYTGLDYSEAMVALAQQEYPGHSFVQGDATALPFPDDSFDIVINGAALMHILDYKGAIAESRRVAKSWCIFHTVPVLNKRETSMLTKKAYGCDVVEISFNKAEFESILAEHGLVVQSVLTSIPHGYLSQLYGEPVTALTYICEVAHGRPSINHTNSGTH